MEYTDCEALTLNEIESRLDELDDRLIENAHAEAERLINALDNLNSD